MYIKAFKNHRVFAILFMLFIYNWLRYAYLIWDFRYYIRGDVLPRGLAFQEGLGNTMVLLSMYSLAIAVIALILSAANRKQARFYMLMGCCFVFPVLILALIAFKGA